MKKAEKISKTAQSHATTAHLVRNITVEIECRVSERDVASWTISERIDALRFLGSRARRKKPPAWLEKRIIRARLRELMRGEP